MNRRTAVSLGCVVCCALLAPAATGAAAQVDQAPRPAAAPDWSQRGDLLLIEGRYDEAIVSYRQWLRGHGDDAPAHNRLGLCLQKTGQVKAARKEYERAVGLDACYAEAWNNLGTLDHVRGKYKRAVSAYRKAVECKPESASFHANLGGAYLALGNISQATVAYGEALRLDPALLDRASPLEVSEGGADAAGRYFELARDYARRGELEIAVKFLNKARASGLRDFAARVSAETAFAELLRDPRYTELLR